MNDMRPSEEPALAAHSGNVEERLNTHQLATDRHSFPLSSNEGATGDSASASHVPHLVEHE